MQGSSHLFIPAAAILLLCLLTPAHIFCALPVGVRSNLFWEGNQSNVNVSPLAYLRADLYCANHETLRIALGFGPSHVKSDSFAFSHQLSCPQRFFSSSMELRLCQFCSHLWLLPMWFCYRWVWQNSGAKQCFFITVTVRVTSTHPELPFDLLMDQRSVSLSQISVDQ